MRKKLFAVIMSAMMMITFMPTMAFAGVGAGVTSWTKDFNTIKWTGHSAATFKDAEGEETAPSSGVYQFTGLMKASAKTDPTMSVEYYDLDNASVYSIGGKAFDSSVNEYKYSDLFGTGGFFNGLPSNATTTSNVKLSFAKPACDGEYNVPTGKSIDRYKTSANLGASEINTLTDMSGDAINATIEVEVPNYDETKKFEAQTFTLNAWVKATINTSTGNPYNKDTMDYFKGSLKPITIKVAAQEANFDMLNYQLDGKDITGPIYYDGAEHTFAQETLPNITSTYELLNSKTHAYEAVSSDGVKIKNAGTYQMRITAKNSKTGETETWNESLVVDTADDVYVTFKGKATVPTEYNFNVAGKYDVKDYLTVVHAATVGDTWFAQTKKAVAADKKVILEYFNEVYDVVVEDNEATFEAKTLTAAQEKALETKYADLLGNFDSVCYSTYEISSAKFNVIDNITFTKAPLKKTYAAKKGKLPKNKTFYVKAKAASGATLVYKLTKGAGKIVVNAKSGKVTVKKGLKKGTYKVGVHAITVDTFNGGAEKWVQDSYTLKIKVK